MPITHLLNKNVTIQRLSSTSGDKMAMVTVTASDMHIQPIADFGSLNLDDGAFGKTFKIYLDGGIDVQAGDRLKDADGFYYTVRNDGYTRRTFGSIDYVQLLATKND